MNRFLYILKSLFAIAPVIIFPLSLLLVAYPNLPIEILSAGLYLFSLAVCFLIWKRKTSDAMRIGRFLLPDGILDIFYKKN